MQHPRFALRAVRKRGQSIAALTFGRDTLTWFFYRIVSALSPEFFRLGL